MEGNINTELRPEPRDRDNARRPPVSDYASLDWTENAFSPSAGDLFEKRRHLMNDWAQFCERPAGDSVVVFNRVSR